MYPRPRFSVIAHHSECLGRHVSVANVRECDDFGASAVIDAGAKLEKPTLPFRTQWIVPLILPIIVDTPAIWNKNLRQALLAYSSDTSLTDLILQEARTEARDQLFGKADKNPKYAEGMKSGMVRIKNFRIPTRDVVGQATPHTSLDNGRSPGNAYLNRVEVWLTYSPVSQIRTDVRDARLKAKCYAHTQCLDKMHPEHPDYGRLWKEKLCVPCGWC